LCHHKDLPALHGASETCLYRVCCLRAQS
jgi:hypothetical protein